MSLQAYIQDTRILLRDGSGLFTPDATLIRLINKGRSQVAEQTGCVRRLVYGAAPAGTMASPGFAVPGGLVPGAPSTSSFVAMPGLEKYSYGYAEPYLKSMYDGIDEIMDVVSVAVSYGSARPVLSWMPWEDLQAYARSSNAGGTGQPSLWSTYSEGKWGEVWLFPTPSTAGEMEWDVFCRPQAIYTNDDFDAIPEPFRHAVSLYAAFSAYMASQRFGLAEEVLKLYNGRLGINRVAVDRGKTTTWW